MGICRLYFFFFCFSVFYPYNSIGKFCECFCLHQGFNGWILFFCPGFAVSCEGKHFTDSKNIGLGRRAQALVIITLSLVRPL